MSDVRPSGPEPSEDPHLPDPDDTPPVHAPSAAWVPEPTDDIPVDPPSTAWVPPSPAGPSAGAATPGGSATPAGAPTAAPPGPQAATPGPATDPTHPGSGAPDPRAVAPGMDDRERPLGPKVVTAWRIGSLISMILPTLVLSTVAFVFLGGWGWVVLGALVALALFLTLWYAPARYERWRWRLTDLAVELRFGVVVRQQETVPYFRIQQIDIVQGPLDRILDLATLQVTTASASGSAALPGIPNDDAPTVRAELLARAAAAVADHPGDLRDAV